MPEQIRLTLDGMLERFKYLGKDLPAAVYSAMILSAEAMLADVVRNRMSGQYLGVKTGNARRSMDGFARATGNSVEAVIGNPFVYVRAHEQGFSGTVQVRAHARRTRRGSTTVRAHAMRMNVRARHFIRDTVRAAKEPTADRVTRAIYITAKTGKVPTPGQLGAR